ncbi:conserved protein of unknown function [Tepidanaerobacter acetatoxydans Re1]|uniref:DUF1667 domain-containing protein n=1 Tax=Tepidanaerobacter acetatoxydans (strain DSM 21804 / JCM 16047 / Re1) TaxID=1209989 RepID=F4LRZ7_TEPAE|nr:DUF1667 domain-containing protein [Tepidanaerobacter acetatoxydans]AEE92336.1 protein of unknown function DUF1667 [Tepidanaerobacter acetatoxydans Re1]CCP27224.1 conserved protein of unknown function [Tepidanaerobacter acetatoxydans Re1]
MADTQLICTSCPKECNLSISLQDDKIIKIQGNSCKKGIDYAQIEMTDPRRILTTTVLIKDSEHLLLPVRSSAPLPKDMLQEAAKITRGYKVTPPIKRGDVVIANILNSGVHIIASRSIPASI